MRRNSTARPTTTRVRVLAVLLAALASTVPTTAGAATPPVAAASAAPGTLLPTVASPVDLYITGVYSSLFGRAPDPTGLSAWSDALRAGPPRIAVANGITYSGEYRSGLITDSYEAFLGRGPDGTGLQSWLGAMNSGTTIQFMEAGFLASGEYFATAGGTNRSWVATVYADLMGRPATALEIEQWSIALGQGADRLEVARRLLLSTEHLTSVVQSHYLHLLGRGIDPAGNAAWVSAIQNGARVEAVIGGIVASDEYLNRVAGTTLLFPPPPVAPTPPASTPPTGAPGPTTTGVPAGTALRVHDGDLTIRTAGTVVDGLDIRGYLRIQAANVTVKNSIVRGRSGLVGSMSLIQSTEPGVVIQDTEIVASYPSYYVDGFVGRNATFTRVNIHGVVDSIKLTGGNVVIQDSWLHDNLYYASVPSGGDTHNDNIQIQAGDNITVRNNVMTGTSNAVVMITQDACAVSNVSMTGNRVDGGACSINVAEKSYGPVRGIAITGNTFGLNMQDARCAILMPSTTSSISTTTGNLFTDGTVVNVTRG